MSKHILAVIFGLAFALTFLGCEEGSLADKRDGKKYKSVKIGEQVWMAENLNFEVDGSKCYENKAENCEKYGRLYNWETAKTVCPKGWHLPTNMEWDKLYRFADGTLGSGNAESPYKSETAGKFLKAASGWNDNEGKSGNGEDKFGFAALPGGYGFSGGVFFNVGNYGYWWSATEYNAYYAYSRSMYYHYEYALWDDGSEAYLQSVRCVQD